MLVTRQENGREHWSSVLPISTELGRVGGGYSLRFNRRQRELMREAF